jgi:MraZ protein
MFIGEYAHNLDEKSRLAIPVKFRKLLAKGAVVTRGLDGCLVLYPRLAWQALAKKLSQLAINQANKRAFARFILPGAMDMNLDKHGRLVLPDYLRVYAGISKKVVLTGLFDRLEIWDEARWHKYCSQNEKDSVAIAENLGDSGL